MKLSAILTLLNDFPYTCIRYTILNMKLLQFIFGLEFISTKSNLSFCFISSFQQWRSIKVNDVFNLISSPTPITKDRYEHLYGVIFIHVQMKKSSRWLPGSFMSALYNPPTPSLKREKTSLWQFSFSTKSPRGVVAYVLERDFVVREFEFQLRSLSDKYFRKGYEPVIPPAVG